MSLSDVEDLRSGGRGDPRNHSGSGGGGGGRKPAEEEEPTFIVTMDGIDEKYFEAQAKKVGCVNINCLFTS